MEFRSWLRGSQRRPVRAGGPRRRKPKTPPRAFEELEPRLNPSTSFLAVGAGDATSSDAILWTRAQDSGSTAGVALIAQVSTDQTFASGMAAFAGTTDPTQDYTIHIDATGLQSGTRYYYRFVAGDNTVSPVGTFKTAPDPTAQAAVHFGFTGDADGQMRPYDAADGVTAPGVPSFANQNFDYFVWLGDTIYETASGGTGPNASPATPSTSTAGNLTPAGLATMEQAYWAKYRQQLQPVSTGGDPGLQSFFSSTGHYTLLDNHELGNKQVINGGAAPGSSPAGIGVDPTNTANDVNTTGTYMNQTPVFQTLQQAYTDYQPIRVETVNAPGDPRSNGTQRLYFAQQWGANSIFFNLDDRSYRDIRLKKADGTTDDTGPRADNAARTMLGPTQLNWFEQGLLSAQAQGITWKFVAVSSPIDQIGAIGSGADGGKSWMGGYRAERNQLLQFIADNHIDHVVFLSTDDHQVRVNELGYFTQFDANGTPVQSSYTRVPGAFEIVCGPIGATGPDTITDRSIANIQGLAQSLANQEIAAGVDPIGLDPNFPGLKNVSREGDPGANANRSPFDFYSPDTFNYAALDVDPSGQSLTVTIDGMNSYAVNTFPQPGAGNPVRQILQFTISLTPVQAQANSFNLTEGSATVDGPVATFTDPGGTTFAPGNLLVSRSVYGGSASTVTVGQALPGGGTAVADGSYPGVWANEAPDPSFGVTSPIFLDQLTASGTPVGTPLNVTAALGNTLATSFPSKSELALNLSADGTAVTFMAYDSPVNALDVSNSNTPGHVDPTNPVGTSPVNTPPTQRAVVQIDANGNLVVTPVNAYSGNNGRAAILGSTGDYYMVGNAGNGGNFTLKGVNTTLGSTTLTATSTAGLEGGQPISGTNIPAGATVVSITDATHFVISAPATGTATNKTATITQDGNTLSMLSDDTGVQMVAPGAGGDTTVVGQVNGTFGSSTGYQRGFSIGQVNPLTGQPYGTADKTGKDDNFRGLTIFNNTLYVTKGSGSNGIDTVYQVGDAGSLPTFADAGTLPITVLPGFPTGLARNIKTDDPATDFHPFGIWFANATTLYVADEGDGTGAANPNAGLEKWSLVNGVWQLDYTLQNGLNLGAKYGVANGPHGEVYPAALDPATDGLRNLTGRVNGDGTATLYAITSTSSTATDQGADPNRLVAITDTPRATTLPANEQFTTLETAGYGEVLRGVSFTPNPQLDHYTATIDWGDGTPASAGTVSLSGSTFSVAGKHTYQEEGDYPIKITITHQGISTTVTGTAHVADAGLSATGRNIAGLEGASTLTVPVATFTNLGGPEAVTDYSATIDWGGAGTGSTAGTIVANGDGSFSVLGSFAYAKDGSYQVAVHIAHENGISADVTGTATIKDNIGILLLDRTGKGALTDSGNGSVKVTGGGAIVVDSSSAQAAVASGNGVVSAAELDAAGATTGGHGSFVGALDTNEAPQADPLANLSAPPVPSAVRSTSTLTITSSVTLQPGLYIGGIRISGQAHVILAPGIYYLQGGGFSVSGQASVTDNGQGVLLYNAPGRSGDGISVSGKGSVSLSGLTAGQLAGLGLTAPQDAALQGLAIFQDPGSAAAISVSGQASVNITGTIYAAGATVNVSGNASLNLQGDATKKFAAHLIAADLSVSGNGAVNVDASNNNLELL
jgi:phosphodiesterase/alkaline phosphatase D-like protein